MNFYDYLEKNFKVNTRPYSSAPWPEDKLLQINERRIVEFNNALRYKEYDAFVEIDSSGKKMFTIKWMCQNKIDVNNGEACHLVNEIHRWYEAISHDYNVIYKPTIRDRITIKILVWSREEDSNDAIPIMLDYIV